MKIAHWITAVAVLLGAIVLADHGLWEQFL
jgi:hypothetical protein